MKRRITAIILCMLMLISLFTSRMSAAANADATCTYSITADKKEAKQGEIINFTIHMQQTGTQNSLEAWLMLPDGLTYITGSGEVLDGVNTMLGWTGELEGVAWTESVLLLNGFGSTSYTGTEKLPLMNLQCRVDGDAQPGEYIITLVDLVADDAKYETKNPEVEPIVINVVEGSGDVADGVLGDVNGDGVVDTSDAQAIFNHFMGIAELPSDKLALADITGEGQIDTSDAQAAFNLFMGII